MKEPGEVYSIILNERLIQGKEKVNNEQGCFREGKGRVDQISAIRMIIEKYLEKDKKIHTALEKDL